MYVYVIHIYIAQHAGTRMHKSYSRWRMAMSRHPHATRSRMAMSRHPHAKVLCHTCGNELIHSYMAMSWFIHTCKGVMSHVWMNHIDWYAWMRHVTYVNESCLMRAWVMSHVWMNNIGTHEWDMSLMWMSHVTRVDESYWNTWMRHVTHVNESCHTCEWVMSHVWINHIGTH